ncbi:replicative DNA helicase [Tepidibacter formicigenes]|jgi:replicative DNA helicase|uniref:Replicative DNA helicase n=1 Tax=Tepidibacter formicigenes DSM 15518 TaxID=1123349 RepID=A0A1M6SMY0_9FIRM|nr:replicative DNA helicase [Tepidibacter formicigenes]SHK45997.1 replicative DNA helicase [Tepidibacter formicigenes DSM 15518]
MNIAKEKPSAIPSEQTILGTILVYPQRIEDTIEILKPSMFYEEINQIIYKAMLTLYKQNKNIDPANIYEITKGKIDISYLTRLTEACINYNLKEHCETIKEKAKLRFIIEGAYKVLGMAFNNESSDSIINAQNDIILAVEGKESNNVSDINDIITSTLDRIDFNIKNKGKLIGVPTGLVDLDNCTNGLQKTDLIIMAARPSMGKSAVSTNILKNAALRGKTVAMFSLEMSKEQLMERIIACDANVQLDKIKKGNLNDDELNRIFEVNKALAKTKIFIDDNPTLTTTILKSKCKKIKKKYELDLIIVDYLQLMQGDTKLDGNRNQQISKITRELKLLCKELGCPMLLLSQLSRAPELRQNKRPILSDLRESGSIEQDADIVIFLYRDDYYYDDSDKKNILELIIAKHRQGECKTIELACMLEFQKIANLRKY